MQSAITVPWDPILKEINRILVPGGFAQFAEFIYHHTSGTTSTYRKRIFERSPVRRMEQQFIQVSPFRQQRLIFVGSWENGHNTVQKFHYCQSAQNSRELFGPKGAHIPRSNRLMGDTTLGAIHWRTNARQSS